MAERFDFTDKITWNASEKPIPQLYRTLSAWLRCDNGKNTDRILISERKVAENLKISRSAVHKVYEKLLADGLVGRDSDSTCYRICNFRKTTFGQCIGIILPARSGDFLNDQDYLEMRRNLYTGIIDRAARSGLGTIVINLPAPDCRKSELEEFMQVNMAALIGVIHLGHRGFEEDPVLDTLWSNQSIPQVMILSQNKYAHCGRVSYDAALGLSAVAQHLREFGHKSIAVFYEQKQLKRTNIFYELETLFEIRNVLHNSGLHVAEDACFACGILNFQKDAELAVNRLLALKNPPSAIWCRNDRIALCVIRNLQKHGFRVPEDFSVIGMDDILEGRFCSPPLTTLQQPYYNIGREAVEMLLAIREKRGELKNRVAKLPPMLIVRGSTGECSKLRQESFLCTTCIF